VTPQHLGQHFLADPAWRERIAGAVLRPQASAEGERAGLWIEIGAGHGEMTALLAQQARHVIAIELDANLLPDLRAATARLANVSVVPGDVLSLNLGQMARNSEFGGEPDGFFHVYGNLPYYITSPIVHHLFQNAGRLESAFLVVQREVAERIAANPGSRDYGYFSTFTQWYSRPEIMFRIPPGAFQPPPQVESALIALRIPGERVHLGVQDESAFLRFLKVCFAQKRKTLRNNLRSAWPADLVDDTLSQACIAPGARAEQLTLAEFARLFAAWKMP
jgi:16S rRNA (adenine1518-N6/adenine1519-N6)-dimethyltransferase